MANGATPDLSPVLDAVTTSVAWLKGDGSHQDTQRQVLKLGEEYGEAAQAWFGVLGNNPRKGVTHTPQDVAAELADTTLVALVALASDRHGDPKGATMRACIAARRIRPATGHDVTVRLLAVQRSVGECATASFTDNDGMLRMMLAAVVADTLSAIACLGFDPAEVLTAKARKVSARIADQEAAT